jgi:hypothetical protein
VPQGQGGGYLARTPVAGDPYLTGKEEEGVMSQRPDSEVEEQRWLEDWLARSGTRDTALERMARHALHEHRAGCTEPVPTNEREGPRR